MWCCRSGDLPAVAEATGAVALQFAGVDRDSAIVRLTTAERGREGSAAKSIRRTNVHLAALCRETGAPPPLSANAQWQWRAHHGKHRHWTVSCRREPSSLPEPRQLRAKFCSTALQLTVFPLVWNETGTRVSACYSLPARRQHNDLKSPTTRKSQSERLLHAGRISYFPQSRMQRDCSNVFFRFANRCSAGRCDFRWRQWHVLRHGRF
jgi:hypothetical protein